MLIGIGDALHSTDKEAQLFFSFVKSIKNGMEYETRIGKALVRHDGEAIFLELDAIPSHGRVILRHSPEEKGDF